ncbi:flagellar hook-associated protein FlgL [Luedemannella flava]|uniref:Flagellar hook-associated protein FlgL n=1 Tax=Luedemannella flava TaxID=349316 RepID=A0ABN2MAG6_9ACTN
MQNRITESSISARVLSGLQANLNKMGRLQEQLSSGKLIARPSDSPTGTVAAMRLRTDIRTAEQYARNIDDGLGWLSTADQTLTGTLPQLNRVRDLVLQGKSTGAANTVDSREALATEVEQIRDSLINLANTRYLDRPIFGGTTTGTVAFDASSPYDFTGTPGVVERRIGDNAKVQVNLDATEVFGANGNNMFTMLTDIADKLRTAPESLSSSLDALDNTRTTITTQLAEVGARYNRLTTMRDTGAERIITLKSQLSDFEDIDLPNTIMEVQLQQTAYQAALAATAKVVQTSLVDFLR